MFEPTTPTISVSMSRADCKKLIFILGIYVQHKSEAWKQWANEISQFIEAAVRDAGSERIPVLNFQMSIWNTFEKIVPETCLSLDDYWQQWASKISAEIQRVLNKEEPPSISESPILNVSPSKELTKHNQSKADEYYEKGLKAFLEIFGEQDKSKVSAALSRAQGYLTMAYKAAGDNVEEKKGIAGLMALVLTSMDDYKNAEKWGRDELAINPTHVYALLALFFVELDKLGGHKGFVTQGDGSGFGEVISIFSVGVDMARVQSKKNAIKKAAIEESVKSIV